MYFEKDVVIIPHINLQEGRGKGRSDTSKLPDPQTSAGTTERVLYEAFQEACVKKG